MAMRVKILALLLSIVTGTMAQADTSFSFRLSPGPRLVGTRAASSGAGTVTATLAGNTLTLAGEYRGLLGNPGSARLMMGPAPGVRGVPIADLTITPAIQGRVSGSVRLDAAGMAAFYKGGLYLEIDSAEAPDGDLWGWVMAASE
jgi:hypothetical protein